MRRDPFEDRKPGNKPPPGRIGVYDHERNFRGHVGRTATSATAARFIGQHGATLGKVDGKTAWIGPKPPPPKPPKPAVDPAAAVGAPGTSSSGSHTLEISLRQAKGSVKKTAGSK